MNEEATDVYVDECLKIYKLQRRKNETSRLGHRNRKQRSARNTRVLYLERSALHYFSYAKPYSTLQKNKYAKLMIR